MNTFTILNTPESVKNLIFAHFPTASIRATVKQTEEVVLEILLDPSLPEIILDKPIYKEAFELRLKEIKILKSVNWEIKPLLYNQSFFYFMLAQS